MIKVEELAHAQLPLKETISKYKQELGSMHLAVKKAESMRENIERDCKESLHAQRSLTMKIEMLILEKQELKQLVEMKSNLIQGIQERSSLVSHAGARMDDKHR